MITGCMLLTKIGGHTSFNDSSVIMDGLIPSPRIKLRRTIFYSLAVVPFTFIVNVNRIAVSNGIMTLL